MSSPMENTNALTHIQRVLAGLTYTQSEMGVDGESGWRVVMTSQMVGRLPALSRPVEDQPIKQHQSEQAAICPDHMTQVQRHGGQQMDGHTHTSIGILHPTHTQKHHLLCLCGITAPISISS